MQRDSDFVTPAEAGKALMEAMGMAEVKGVTAIHIKVEGGALPVVTVTRHMTREQLVRVSTLLESWDMEPVAKPQAAGPAVRGGASAGEAAIPLFPSSHPREG